MAGRSSGICEVGTSRSYVPRVLSVIVVLLVSLQGFLPVLPLNNVWAQTDPPLYGDGSWVISDNTIVKDQSIYIRGDVIIMPGGSLTLENTTLQLHMSDDYMFNIHIQSTGSLYVTKGSYIGTTDRLCILDPYPGSKLRVSDSQIHGLSAITSGSSDAIIERSNITFTQTSQGVVSLAGHLIIRNSTVYGSDLSVWDAQGDIDIYDSTIGDTMSTAINIYPFCRPNGFGPEFRPVWLPPWFPSGWASNPYCALARNSKVINNKIIFANENGVKVDYSTATIEGNDISVVTGSGVHVEDTSSVVTVRNNNISNVWLGIMVDIQSSDMGSPYFKTQLTIENNNIIKCKDYAFFIKDGASTDVKWDVYGRDSYVDSPVQMKAPVRIYDGGHLKLDKVAMTLHGLATSPNGIMVDQGGELTLEGVTTEVKTPTLGTYLKVMAGGGAHILNSTIVGIGYDFGTNGENGGVYSAGMLDISHTLVKAGLDGLVIGGGNTTVRNSVIVNHTDGIQVLGGGLEIYDSFLDQFLRLDMNVEDGLVNLYNTTFNHGRYTVSGGCLNVFWESEVETMWENGEPIGNVDFNVVEKTGAQVVSGQTGDDGLSDMFYLREFTDTGSGKLFTTSHNVSGAFNGMTNFTDYYVDANTRIPLLLPDHIAPWLKVISPGLIAYQTNNTLFVNGTAGDNESGMDRVQWSLDLDLWTDTNGVSQWNFSIFLRFGAHEVYLRAIDKAGNKVLLTMKVTIDTTAPFLFILSPKNGFVTKLRTVLVEGATEYGATIVIKDQTIVSVDGTFRASVPIDEGENNIVVTAKDDTGNSNSSSVKVIRDTTPPKIIITSPPDFYITNRIDEQNLPIIGSTDIGAKLMSQGRAITVNVDGTFSFTYGLKEGQNVIDLIAEDELGNQNSTVRHVFYDRTIPPLNITSPVDGYYTNKTSVTVSGNTEADANVTARSINFTSTTVADSGGRFEVNIGLSEGQNIIQVTAKDRAGNIKTGTVTVYRDTVAPLLTLNNIKDEMLTEQIMLIVEGQTEIGAMVKVNGDILPVGRTGLFGTTLNLFSANNTFVFEAVDRAGNAKVVTYHIKRKAPQEPKPTGVGAAFDYMPWLALVIIIILVVQFVLLSRHQMLKAKKDKTEDASEQQEEAPPEVVDEKPRQRVRPKGPRGNRPVVVDHGEPEFDIEYGDGVKTTKGGGRP